MDAQDQDRIWRGIMRHWSRDREPVAMDKNAIRAAVVATDQWIEANQAAYNAALPDPFRSDATAVQKTLVFCAVALARVSIAFLARVFGGV